MQTEKVWRAEVVLAPEAIVPLWTWRRDMHRFGRTDRQLLPGGLSLIATAVARGLMMTTIALRRLAAEGGL